MGELRDRFWELPLEALDRAEWEALCDGCGRCCLHKLEDEDTGRGRPDQRRLPPARHRDRALPRLPAPQGVRARLPAADAQAGRAQCRGSPPRCAYRRRAEGQPLPDWHPLLTGGRRGDEARRGDASPGKVVSETDAGPLEHHIVDWDPKKRP